MTASMLSNPFLRRGRSQETGRLPWLTSQDMIFRVNEMERNTRSMDSFVQRYLFNSSSFIACDIHLPIIRIKTHGEVPRVMQRATLMSIALTRTRTIPTPYVAVVFSWNAMGSIPASILMRVFLKTASALNQTLKKCENYGFMSSMQTLVKLEK